MFKVFSLEKNQAFQSQNMIWVEKRDFLPKIRKKDHWLALYLVNTLYHTSIYLVDIGARYHLDHAYNYRKAHLCMYSLMSECPKKKKIKIEWLDVMHVLSVCFLTIAKYKSRLA